MDALVEVIAAYNAADTEQLARMNTLTSQLNTLDTEYGETKAILDRLVQSREEYLAEQLAEATAAGEAE
jgi:hypothetical protein